jgi:hypothetical protein
VSSWSPVVYGRTLHIDQWWRALPAGLSLGHWVTGTVLDTVGHGYSLVRYHKEADSPPEQTPRFALARGRDGTLVGLACRARAISADMCQDWKDRELYCFVGWFSPDPGTPELPTIADLRPVQGSWAGQVYRTYFEPVWKEPRGATLTTQVSHAGPAPWRRMPVSPSDDGTPLLAPDGRVVVSPAAMADRLWRDGVGSPGPFFLVTGWQEARDASLARITHLCADDLTEPGTVSRPPSTVPPNAVPSSPAGDDRTKPHPADTPAAEPRSHLQATRLAADYRAATRRVPDDPAEDGIFGWVVRLIRAILGFDTRPPQTPRVDPSYPQARREDPPPRLAPPAPPVQPVRRQTADPPPDIELPQRSGDTKPFEGLE